MAGGKNQRVEDLRKMGRDALDNIARKHGVAPEKSKVGTARKIEQREFTDRRQANKRPHIKDIF
jgi:hypothetical protein